jgi:hypothetical protein
MKSRLGFFTLLGLNGLMAVMGWLLFSFYREERTALQSLRSGLSQLRSDLSHQSSHAADRDYTLENLRRLLSEVKGSLSKESTEAQSSGDSVTGTKPADLLSQLSLLAVRPDVDTVARMPQEEFDRLTAKWRQVDIKTQRAGRKFEMGVDVDTVLARPEWNPTGRALSLDERIELTLQLQNLKYFATSLPFESLHDIVLPEADRKRALGEYVEYDEPPPMPPGVSYSHGEATGVEGVSRMYYFTEDEYPDLYHRWNVGNEQKLKARVAIYEIINGRIAPATTGG